MYTWVGCSPPETQLLRVEHKCLDQVISDILQTQQDDYFLLCNLCVCVYVCVSSPHLDLKAPDVKGVLFCFAFIPLRASLGC